MIIATAGHVDHGKTALVKALTGVDTDRLPQEKARGISIDLGFAYTRAPGGATLGFVDVPGHERFVRNMLAGVCGIDYVLLVVAADDGVMPQTREHLDILDLLDVRDGIVVITKADAVDAQRLAAVRQEVAALMTPTTLHDAAVVAVSSLTGAGIADLRATLDAAATRHARTAREGRGFRFAVDRVFTVAGSGTVVTGTVFDGSVRAGDALVIAPSGRPVRVRGVQHAGHAVDSAAAGERCALNVTGANVDDIARGDWLQAEPLATTRLDVELTVLAGAPHPLRHWTPVHLHIGTAAVTARVAMRRGESVAPGATVVAQLCTDRPIAATNGDRFIVRDPSATFTVGGGVIIDPLAPTRRVPQSIRSVELAALATRDPAQALAKLLAGSAEGVDIARFARTFNLAPAHRDALLAAAGAIVVDRRHALPAVRIATLEADAVAAVDGFHGQHPQLPGLALNALRAEIAPALGDETFAALLRTRAGALGLEIGGATVHRRGHVTTANKADETLWQRTLPRLIEAGFHGIALADLALDLRIGESVLTDFLHRKAATGDVHRVNPHRFYPRALMAELAALATDMAANAPDQSFIAAQFRDRSGVNRTLAIEILECLDRLGITQRVGDARKVRKDFVAILGPARVPPPAPPKRVQSTQKRQPPARHPWTRPHHAAR
ncbi:MAG: selenocysteine-specific translation elongation factor [Proteobacteria bacterium]|nr:selenocysteine-specific translation elongation factor [Pseudomonadota bacterium]